MMNRKIFYITVIAAVIVVSSLFLYWSLSHKGPVCGNGVCEYFETPGTCCKDCECWGQGEVCNLKLNKCEKREIRITDERIRELVVQYFGDKGKEVVSMNITGLITWENKLGKNVMVYLKDQEWFTPVVVTEDEKVIEIKV